MAGWFQSGRRYGNDRDRRNIGDRPDKGFHETDLYKGGLSGQIGHLSHLTAKPMAARLS
jgi:hypothetical protein